MTGGSRMSGSPRSQDREKAARTARRVVAMGLGLLLLGELQFLGKLGHYVGERVFLGDGR